VHDDPFTLTRGQPGLEGEDVLIAAAGDKFQLTIEQV
jgi:hypothetical protein